MEKQKKKPEIVPVSSVKLSDLLQPDHPHRLCQKSITNRLSL